MVVTSEYSKPLGDLLEEATHNKREVWVEWGELSYGNTTVPATHIFYLDEDGYMKRDGSGLSVVAASDYYNLTINNSSET